MDPTLEDHKSQYVRIEMEKSVHKRELSSLNKDQRVHYEAIIEAMEHGEMSIMHCGNGFTITKKSKVPEPSAKDLIQILTEDQKETLKVAPRSPKITFATTHKKRKQQQDMRTPE
jgi:Cdc6-like AAA superfamily ATPase